MWKKLERGELTREQILVMRFELLFDELGVEVSAQKAKNLYEDLLGRVIILSMEQKIFLRKLIKNIRFIWFQTARRGYRTDGYAALASEGISKKFLFRKKSAT